MSLQHPFGAEGPLDAGAVARLCDAVAAELPDGAITVMMELAAFRDTRTAHDASRLVRALRHVAQRQDLAAQVEALLQ
jgi:hypothetical protein